MAEPNHPQLLNADAERSLELIFARNSFYRRQYLLALSAFGLSLLVMIILLAIILYLKRHPTRPIYFAADNVSRLIKIIPVSEKNMTTDELFAWVIDAVQNARSYDFMNFRAQLQNAQKYFTPSGWQNYMRGFNAANNLPGVIADRRIVLAKVVGVPEIKFEGILAGARAWKIELPLLVTSWTPPYNDTSKFSNALKDTIIVQRQSVLQSYRGLGIVQLIEEAQNVPTQPEQITNTPTG